MPVPAAASASPWLAGAQLLSGLAGLGQGAPAGPAISGPAFGAPITVSVGGLGTPPPFPPVHLTTTSGGTNTVAAAPSFAAQVAIGVAVSVTVGLIGWMVGARRRR